MIKVCHITSVHKKYDVRIFEKECSSLVLAGYDVSLVVANAESETLNGVKIVGVHVESSNRLLRFMNTSRKVIEAALEQKADIYHFHDPELLMYAGKLRKAGAKVIYDSHEDVPRQILDKPYIPKWMRGVVSKTVEKIENRVVKKVLTGVVAATPHIEERFRGVARYVVNINNYPKLSSFGEPGEWDEREVAAGYVGGIFFKRGAVEMVKALENNTIPLHLAGNFSPQSLRDQLVDLPGWKNVVEYGFVDRQAISEILSKIKVGLVILHPTPSYIYALPIKMFEYMAAGIPVIASDFELWKNIIDDAGCGICVDPFNISEIEQALNKILQDDHLARKMGENGRKAVLEKYNWESEAAKLSAFYVEILN